MYFGVWNLNEDLAHVQGVKQTFKWWRFLAVCKYVPWALQVIPFFWKQYADQKVWLTRSSCVSPNRNSAEGCRWIASRNIFVSVQFSSVAQWCPTLCNPMDWRMPGSPVHHQLSELAQTHVHWVGDAIQASHPLSSPSPYFLRKIKVISEKEGIPFYSWSMIMSINLVNTNP